MACQTLLCDRLWWFSFGVVGDAVAVVGGQCVEDGFPAVGFAGEVAAVLSSGGGDKVEDLHGGLLVAVGVLGGARLVGTWR